MMNITPTNKPLKVPRFEEPSPSSLQSPSTSSIYTPSSYHSRQNRGEVVVDFNREVERRGEFEPSRKVLGMNCEGF